MAKLTPEQATEKLQALLDRPGGVSALVSSVKGPLKKFRDYYSVARKVLLYDPLPAKEVARYDMDPECYAYQIPFMGASPVRMNSTDGATVDVTTFDLIAYKEFPMSFFKKARYNLPQRLQQALRSAINEMEDGMLFPLLDSVYSDSRYPYTPVAAAATLTADILNRTFALIEDRVDVGCVLGQANMVSQIRTFGDDIFAPAEKESILRTGQIGTVWGAKVLKSKAALVGRIYVTGLPEYTGRIPEFAEPTPIKGQNTKDAKVEVSVWENIGLMCHNPYALAVWNKS